MSSPFIPSLASTLDTPLWFVVPAAGSGQRLGGEVAKQYQVLDGTSMLERTIRRILSVPAVAGVVCVIAKDDSHWEALQLEDEPRVHTTIGGDTRAESVLAGIEFVLSKASANTWTLVHDAARPLVALDDIRRLINAVYNSGAVGGLLATPVHDTLKKTDDYATVVQTVERRDLWQAQTPQLFRGGQLHQALLGAMKTHSKAITDEASAMELAGHQPLLVEALKPNFKITRPVDWQLASALLTIERLAEESAVQ